MKRLISLSAIILLAMACVKDIDNNPKKNDNASTKIINTADNAAKGSLLVKMENYTTEWEYDILDNTAVTAEPLFPAGAVSEETLRTNSIYRWWKLSFDEGVNLESMAKAAAQLESVKIVEYNEIMECIDDISTSSKEDVTMPLPSTTRANAVKKDFPFNDTYAYEQWHYYNDGNQYYDGPDYPVAEPYYLAGADINVVPAWKYTAGDPRVIVAVIDSGVKYTNPDLASNMWVNEDEIPDNGIDDDRNGYIDDIHGYNFVNNTNAIDFLDHGTHVAGTIAAVNNNGFGVCGIAGGTGKGDGCRIMTCQINGSSFAEQSDIAKAIKYAADNGAVIINNSWVSAQSGAFTSDYKYYQSYSVLLEAISYFENNAKLEGVIDGGIAIFAAGNNGLGNPCYPGAYYKNICVTAFGPNLVAGPYTNYGIGANICAPGGFENGWMYKIISTDTSEFHVGAQNGTSMATPHVSGCAALGLSYALKLGKTFTAEEFRNIILTSVHDIDRYQTDSKYKGKLGAGYIDAHLLLMQVEGTPCIYIKANSDELVSLDSYFGEASESLTYTSVEMSAEAKASLGISQTPAISNGKLSLRATKRGTGRIKVTAIVGGKSVGGGDNMGGMEVTREFEIVARTAIAANGGWL